MKSIKTILFIFFLSINLSALDTNIDEVKNININESKIFGSNLFNGGFSNSKLHKYNPNYILNIGDSINLKLWGAISLELNIPVDKQGNIFIPNVGIAKLLGVKNSNLTKVIKKQINKVYKDNVFIYASLDNYQPIEIFVSGAVNKPGLYSGLSSNSILQFIDKAKGISRNGSFRNISILRDNITVSNIDLYNYLINGKLNSFQFKNGDVINIPYIEKIITVDGDIERKLQIEFKNTKLKDIIKISKINNGVTDIIISRYQNGKENKKMFNISQKNINILPNDNISFISNNNSKTLKINISGEHDNNQNIILKKGTNLKQLLNDINFTSLSLKEDISLYRKSVANLQKELLHSSLNELESMVLKTGASTTEEAIIRKQEAALVLDFIKRAKKVEPKGRVILNKNSNLEKVILEEGDNIYIPKSSHIITIQGEVKIPSALTFVKDMPFEDYISMCGGLISTADKENILIIHQNGKVSKYLKKYFQETNSILKPGDSILVLGKSDTKNLQMTKDITQIIYQIAVSAGVLIGL